ncbi:MAG TPA: glycoside hydrolase domain-containing protein [Chitinophagaceae bacterium]
MKKTIAVLSLNFLAAGIVFSQPFKGQVDSMNLPAAGPAHYQPEYDIDISVDPQAWTKEKQGMHVAFGSEDELYFRTEVPQIKNESASWEATGWKGERLNTQIVVWSPDTLEQVRFKVSDLKNEKGKLLSKENILLNKVCYVLANYPYNSDKPDCNSSPYKNGFLMPDRFEAAERFDVPGKTVRPVWLSLNIPADAEPGIYNGTIEVSSKNGNAGLNIKVKVQNQALPKPRDWHYRLDLWQNPWVIADFYHVKPWGEEHKMLLKKHLQLYADAGGTFITTYGVHSPWSDNEYAIEGGMIEWVKQKNGSWKFDYNIFDQYVELAMSMGIDKAITIYTPVPNNNRFRYIDEKTGNYVYESWPPQSDTFKTVWNIFLNDLKIHLEKKGWFEKTYIGINESELSQTLAAIKVVKENSKKWKITYAGDWHKELDTLLDDYCSVYEYQPSLDEVKARSAKGYTSTFYVCCHPAKPNNFLFSPPIEGRWQGWFSAAHGYNGFLRWAYDAWPEDPMRDARYGSWASGDSYLIYPGGNSCIRFEKLREGVVDYEKIRIIRELAAKSSDASVKNLMKAFAAHLQTLNDEKSFNEEKLKNDVAKGREMIDELSEKLGNKLF